MPDFQTVRPVPGSQGLFSSEEIEQLMRIEFERAQRHRYPVVCMEVAVDRLPQLQDLYGTESKEEILRAVVGVLGASTREMDLLGRLAADRLVVIFPHTPPEVAPVLARRILAGARRLRFDRDGRTLSISLSIGITHNRHEKELAFETLLGVVEEGLRQALSGGGDRFVQVALDEIYERRAAPRAPLQRRSAPAAEPAPSEERTLLEILAASGWHGESLKNIDPGVLARTLEALFEARAIRATPGEIGDEEALAAARERIEQLERRIAKLTHVLGVTEDELKRVAAMKGIDLGVASIYRTVQGLADDATQRELKRSLMREIFEANVRLQKQPEGQPGRVS